MMNEPLWEVGGGRVKNWNRFDGREDGRTDGRTDRDGIERKKKKYIYYI